jgi:hypothetical protein
LKKIEMMQPKINIMSTEKEIELAAVANKLIGRWAHKCAPVRRFGGIVDLPNGVRYCWNNIHILSFSLGGVEVHLHFADVITNFYVAQNFRGATTAQWVAENIQGAIDKLQ